MDNKEKDGYEYFVSVNTAVRSSRTLTSNCFFKLKGEEKDTGNRVLNDGCRKVSYFYYFSSIVKVVIYAGSKVAFPGIKLYALVLNTLMRDFHT